VVRYPALSKKAEGVLLRGHAADIPKLRFTCDDKYILSIGQTDRTILVWKITRK